MAAVFFTWAYNNGEAVYLDWRESETSHTGGWLSFDEDNEDAQRSYWRKRELPDTMQRCIARSCTFKKLTRCQARKLLREKGLDYLELPK